MHDHKDSNLSCLVLNQGENNCNYIEDGPQCTSILTVLQNTVYLYLFIVVRRLIRVDHQLYYMLN